MMEALLELINCGGNVAVAVCLYYLYSEVRALRRDLGDYRTATECNVRHGHSCERLDKLEHRVDGNSVMIAEIKGRVNK